MSKKYFINNIDSLIGELLLKELIKEGEEEAGPSIMGTFSDAQRQDPPPKGMKKILKRYKPKLFRKKLLEECDTMIYRIEDAEDIKFGIDCVKWQNLEEPKQFVVISNVLSWAGQRRKQMVNEKEVDMTIQSHNNEHVVQQEDIKEEDKNQDDQEDKEDQEDEEEEEEGKELKEGDNNQQQIQQQQQVKQSKKRIEKEISYESYKEIDYNLRVPLNHARYIAQKELEDQLLSLEIPNLKVIIVGSGMQYGYKEQTLQKLMEAAWKQSPSELTYFKSGENTIPSIHMKDLSKIIIQRVCEQGIGDQKYILAIDNSNNKTQKSIVQSISSQIGTGNVNSVDDINQLLVSQDYLDWFMCDLDIQPSSLLVQQDEVNEENNAINFEWKSLKGIGANLNTILQEFNLHQNLKPFNIIIISDQQFNDQLKLNQITEYLTNFYNIPLITIHSIVNDLLTNNQLPKDSQLVEDFKEKQEEILKIISTNSSFDQISESIKIITRMMKWRLCQNDCRNRGYILQNYPIQQKLAELVFKTQKQSTLKKMIQNEIVVKKNEEGDDIVDEEQKGEQVVEGEEEFKQTLEKFCPESVIILKKLNQSANLPLFKSNIEQFFRQIKLDVYTNDSSTKTLHENIENLMIHIERNGRPNNYLQDFKLIVEKHLEYYTNIDKQINQEKEKVMRQKQEENEKQENVKQKILEEQLEYINNNEILEYDDNFRKYLITHVNPYLQEALLEVSEMRPADPIDFLAQILYQKSYDV